MGLRIDSVAVVVSRVKLLKGPRLPQACVAQVGWCCRGLGKLAQAPPHWMQGMWGGDLLSMNWKITSAFTEPNSIENPVNTSSPADRLTPMPVICN